MATIRLMYRQENTYMSVSYVTKFISVMLLQAAKQFVFLALVSVTLQVVVVYFNKAMDRIK